MKNYTNKALNISNSSEFEEVALSTFQFQYTNVEIYRKFVDLLGIDPNEVHNIEDIPFLPISVFKNHSVIGNRFNAEITFKSSGTTGMERSQHLVHSLQYYTESFQFGFEHFYGNIKDFTILALLPSYLEQGESSLVCMVDQLIKDSENPNSGFYLNNYQDLIEKLLACEKAGKKTILLGVSYALLDLIEIQNFQLKHTIIMETGGMKGRRKEMVKEELHEVLCDGFGVSKIHSEYGMTELLSQGYSYGAGIFNTPPWMKIIIRDATDPLTLLGNDVSGGINVIDLSNYYSCAFIATQDLGKTHKDGSFEVLGRFDHTDVRGCNLLLA